MKTVKDRVALVTGAGSGIGRSTAVLLARAGCHLVLNDICVDKLEETADLAAHYSPVMSLCGDISDESQVNNICQTAVNQFGEIDILINNAGIAMGGYVDTIPIEAWEDLMRLNFWAYVYTTRALLPAMLAREEGYLVYVASISGLLTSPNSLPYGTSKFAVVCLAESVAAYTKPKNIGVSLICPGITRTHIADNARYFFSSEQETSAARQWFKKSANRGIPPDKVAQKILNAIQKNQYFVMTSTSMRLLFIFRALFPNHFLKINSLFHNSEMEKAKSALKNA